MNLQLEIVSTIPPYQGTETKPEFIFYKFKFKFESISHKNGVSELSGYAFTLNSSLITTFAFKSYINYYSNKYILFE